MAESRIIEFFLSLWKMLVGWYEASFVASIIDGFCDFFKKRADGSAIVGAFMHGILTGKWWKNSLFYRTLCVSGRKKRISVTSGILDAVLNIFNIPLKTIGLGIVTFSVPIFLISALSHSRINLIASLVLLVLGLISMLLSRTLYQLYLGSGFLKLLGGLFYDGEYSEPKVLSFKLLPFLAVSAVFGIIGGLVSPILTVIVIAGVLFVLTVLSRFEIGIYLTLFLAAFLPTALIAGLSLLTIAGFLIALIVGRKKSLKPSALAPLLVFYIILGAFSTLTSFDIGGSLFIFLVYTVFILMYEVMVNTIDTKVKWQGAVAVFAFAVLLIALYGIFQNFTMDATTQSWVDTNMFEDIKIRVYATFDNPNVLGQYFIITLPLIFALFVLNKNLSTKILWLGIFAAGFLCLLYTWSRGAWVGVMLGIAIFLLLRDRRFILLGILCLFALPFVLPESIMSRLLSIGNTGDSSTAYRVSVWIASLRMAMRFWMSGVGYGSDAFARVYSNFALNGAGYALHSHNFYIQLVTDVGVGGLIVFLAIALTACRETATVKKDKLIKGITLALSGALAGYLFQGVAESMWYNLRMSLMFWIMMAFIVSGARLEREGEK